MIKLIYSDIFKRDKEIDGVLGIIFWWELRRVFYNFIVYLIGIVTTMLMVVYQSKYHIEILPDPLLFPIIICGVGANFFYTFGWIVELFVIKILKRRSAHFGEVLFGIGMTFSVVIMVAPVMLAMVLKKIW